MEQSEKDFAPLDQWEEIVKSLNVEFKLDDQISYLLNK